MGQSRYQGRRSEVRTFAHARIWLRLKKSGGAGSFEGRSEDEGFDDQHGARLNRRSVERGGSRPRNHFRLEAVRNQLSLGTLKIARVHGLKLSRRFSMAYRAGPEPVGVLGIFRTFLLAKAMEMAPPRITRTTAS